MKEFPNFVRNPKNRISTASQFTEDVEGYVFDGADGSQAALWSARADRASAEHAHDFDEWVFVLEGEFVAIVGGVRTRLSVGEELMIPRGAVQSMEVTAGTRTLHVFGGKRAKRDGE